MNTLYLVRHAKSSWKEYGLADFDRPLNKRGKRDAPFMAKLLAKLGEKPDLIISSPSLRTKSTALFFAEELEYPESEIIFDDNLYLGSRSTLLNVVKETAHRYSSIMLFAHNPGITDFANFLSDAKIENVPTGGFIKLQCKKPWNETGEGTCELLMFEYPKKYFNE